MINLNHEDFNLRLFKMGKTHNIVVKVGRKLYYVDIDKSANNVHLDFYVYRKDRTSFSKYGTCAKRVSVVVSNTASLSRKFFEDIEEISKAQKLLTKYSQCVC